MKKKNTGLAFSEVRGLLNNLNDNLSGEHADYWHNALKKLLRKETLPEPPPAVLEAINAISSRQNAQEKLDKVMAYLKTIPSVLGVVQCTHSGSNYLMTIYVQTNLNGFLINDTNSPYHETYILLIEGEVKIGRKASAHYMDETYKIWRQKVKTKNIMEFSKSLIALSAMYENAVPVIQ